MPTERATLSRPRAAKLSPERRAVLDAIGAAVLLIDEDGTVVYANPACAAVLGRAGSGLAGEPWRELCAGAEGAAGLEALVDVALAGEVGHGPVEVLGAGGTPLPALATATLVEDGGRLVALTLIDAGAQQRAVDEAISAAAKAARHLSARRAAEAEVRHLARHDRLTGLPNRANLERRLKAAVTRAERRGRSVALLSIDIDGFKLVNASFGHAAGDRLLKRIAARLRTVDPERGLLARYGGDEFLVLLADLGEDAGAVAHAAAAQVATCLAKPFTVAGSRFLVEASVGISLFPADADGAPALLRHAQSAMHQGKGRPHTTPTVYSRGAHDALERLSLSARLRRAVAQDELELYYQPIVSVATGEIDSLEALLRWNDPERGTVAPGQFIPQAEEMGLLEPIGEWVLDALGRQLRAWAAMRLGPPRVAFNVSPRQLHRTDFAEHLGRRLAANRIDPAGLTMEVTESATLRDSDQIDPLLRRLRALGLNLAIDDFGAGWSSLSRLRSMPVGQLKIDRSFLREIPDDPEAGAIVRTVISLAEALGMVTVAEGVETALQRSFLSVLACPLAQGNHFSPPVPAAQVTERLRADG